MNRKPWLASYGSMPAETDAGLKKALLADAKGDVPDRSVRVGERRREHLGDFRRRREARNGDDGLIPNLGAFIGERAP